MSFLQKLAFFCQSLFCTSGSVVECWNLDGRVAGPRHAGFFFICLLIQFQIRETGKPPHMADKLLTRT